jgi:hypothetical protein
MVGGYLKELVFVNLGKFQMLRLRSMPLLPINTTGA